MRNLIVLFVFIFFAHVVQAQTITRNYESKPMSQVLADIAKSSEYYQVNFIYNELEDFLVTCHIKNQSIVEALETVIGLYPVKISIQENHIFVECIEKRKTKVKGKVVGYHSKPIAYVNIAVIDPLTNQRICSGVSNESGDFAIPCDSMRVKVKMSCVGYKTLEKSCMAGEMGVVRLQADILQLQNINITSESNINSHKQNKKYKKQASRIRSKIWKTDNPHFQQTEIADSLRKFPVVSLAESYEGQVRSKHVWKPLRFLIHFFSDGNESHHSQSNLVSHKRIILNDSNAVEKYSHLDYPRDLVMKNDQNLQIVMGIRIVKPDGTLYEIDTDPYTQPLAHHDETRPQKIDVPSLEPGDIIDYFIWMEHKSVNSHPDPIFIQPSYEMPVLSSFINISIGKSLYTQYRHKGCTPILTEREDKNGYMCLSSVSERIAHRDCHIAPAYIVYIRDPRMKANSPLNAFMQPIQVNPPLKDILNTKSHLYDNLRAKEMSGLWANDYWGRSDTTIIGIKVDNLRHVYPSQDQLQQRLFEMVKNYPEQSSVSKSLSFRQMGYNREYTEKLAYVFKRAGLTYQVAMSTSPDRENIDDLMDEENIVWMIVDDRGKCYIPLNDNRMRESMVGRKATTTDFSNQFIIQ